QFNRGFHWQQGPPPYFPYNRIMNQQMMNHRYMQSTRGLFRAPHPQHRLQLNDYDDYVCFICKDHLQNCEDQGVHLCDGGDSSHDDSDLKKEVLNFTVEKESINARLEKLVSEIKDCLHTKYESVTESLEAHVSNRINEIDSINKEVVDEREHLQNLKKELELRGRELEKKEKDLIAREKSFDKHQEKCKRELLKEKEEIVRQWQQLRDEITRMEELHKVQKGRIKLDVGGTIYTTSELTLTRDSESMLAAMFSGRHNIKPEEDGTIFIDRDGTHFRYILNYLRDGGIATDALPRSRQVLRELRNEAIYFQLHSLAQQIEKLLK
ncbi:Hypothetical predicted protein, partial [Mytilus galloprovincialis]